MLEKHAKYGFKALENEKADEPKTAVSKGRKIQRNFHPLADLVSAAEMKAAYTETRNKRLPLKHNKPDPSLIKNLRESSSIKPLKKNFIELNIRKVSNGYYTKAKMPENKNSKIVPLKALVKKEEEKTKKIVPLKRPLKREEEEKKTEPFKRVAKKEEEKTKKNLRLERVAKKKEEFAASKAVKALSSSINERKETMEGPKFENTDFGSFKIPKKSILPPKDHAEQLENKTKDATVKEVGRKCEEIEMASKHSTTGGVSKSFQNTKDYLIPLPFGQPSYNPRDPLGLNDDPMVIRIAEKHGFFSGIESKAKYIAPTYREHRNYVEGKQVNPEYFDYESLLRQSEGLHRHSSATHSSSSSHRGQLHSSSNHPGQQSSSSYSALLMGDKGAKRSFHDDDLMDVLRPPKKARH